MKPQIRDAFWGIALVSLLILVLVVIAVRNPGAWIQP